MKIDIGNKNCNIRNLILHFLVYPGKAEEKSLKSSSNNSLTA